MTIHGFHAVEQDTYVSLTWSMQKDVEYQFQIPYHNGLTKFFT